MTTLSITCGISATMRTTKNSTTVRYDSMTARVWRRRSLEILYRTLL